MKRRPFILASWSWRVAALFALGTTGACFGAAANGVPDDPRYAGSQSCRECHGKFYELWSSSHHGLAMQPFTAELARTKLTAPTESVAIKPYRYRADPAAAAVHEEGPDGRKKYAIEHTLGGKNVFYFLTPLERGRLQVLPLAYDVNRKEWFDTAGSALRHFANAPDTPLHWKDPAYTFNTSCFNCHVSQLTKNFDPKSDSYQTKWGEPGINCETCHGPSAEHVRLARNLKPGEPMKDPKLIVTGALTPAQRNAMCGACHAKLAPLTSNFTPGDRFFDHFAMTTLEDRDFHPDGRDLGENFTMTTWGLSRCAQAGKLDCVHCHTSSGRYKFRTGDPNAACLPCHAERVKTVAQHSHHAADSKGSQCIACHMPMTEFARMRRSDHSMRPPTPATTIAHKSPNACNLCHGEETPSWADKYVREWHKDDYQAPILRRAGMVDAARKGDWSKLGEIVKYLSSPDREEIWAASLLRLLRGCPEETKWPAVLACLTDKSPLVRSAAVETMGDQPRPPFVPALLGATRDDFRLVRVQAAAALASLPRESLSAADRTAVEAATSEYLASLRCRPDDYASRYNLGNFYLGRGEVKTAIEEFDASLHLQPQNVAPFANRALAYAALGQNDKAEQSLRGALALEPGNPAVNLNLGMLLAELGRTADAEQAFRTAFKSDPRSAAAAFNLGVMLSKERPAESLEWCRKAATLQPGDARYGYTLGYFLLMQQKVDDAVTELERVIRLRPSSGEAYALLGRVYQRLNRPADFARVYRAAAENPSLPPEERQHFAR